MVERAFVTEAAFSLDDAVFPGVVTAKYTGTGVDGDFKISVAALGCGRMMNCTLNRQDIAAVRGWLGIGDKPEASSGTALERVQQATEEFSDALNALQVDDIVAWIVYALEAVDVAVGKATFEKMMVVLQSEIAARLEHREW